MSAVGVMRDNYHDQREQVFAASQLGILMKEISSRANIAFSDDGVQNCVQQILNRPSSLRTNSELQFLRRVFKNSTFLQQLERVMSSLFLVRLLKNLKYQFFEADKVIYSVGDPPTDLYFLLSGAVCETTKSEEIVDFEINDTNEVPSPFDSSIIWRTINEGEEFGEISLRYNCPREFSAIAKDDSIVGKISFDKFNVILGEFYTRKRDVIVDKLSTFEIFSSWPRWQVEIAAQSCSSRILVEMDGMFSKGDVSSHVYFLLKGEVQISHYKWKKGTTPKKRIVEKEELFRASALKWASQNKSRQIDDNVANAVQEQLPKVVADDPNMEIPISIIGEGQIVGFEEFFLQTNRETHAVISSSDAHILALHSSCIQKIFCIREESFEDHAMKIAKKILISKNVEQQSSKNASVKKHRSSVAVPYSRNTERFANRFSVCTQLPPQSQSPLFQQPPGSAQNQYRHSLQSIVEQNNLLASFNANPLQQHNQMQQQQLRKSNFELGGRTIETAQDFRQQTNNENIPNRALSSQGIYRSKRPGCYTPNRLFGLTNNQLEVAGYSDQAETMAMSPSTGTASRKAKRIRSKHHRSIGSNNSNGSSSNHNNNSSLQIDIDEYFVEDKNLSDLGYFYRHQDTRVKTEPQQQSQVYAMTSVSPQSRRSNTNSLFSLTQTPKKSSLLSKIQSIRSYETVNEAQIMEAPSLRDNANSPRQQIGICEVEPPQLFRFSPRNQKDQQPLMPLQQNRIARISQGSNGQLYVESEPSDSRTRKIRSVNFSSSDYTPLSKQSRMMCVNTPIANIQAKKQKEQAQKIGIKQPMMDLQENIELEKYRRLVSQAFYFEKQEFVAKIKKRIQIQRGKHAEAIEQTLDPLSANNTNFVAFGRKSLFQNEDVIEEQKQQDIKSGIRKKKIITNLMSTIQSFHTRQCFTPNIGQHRNQSPILTIDSNAFQKTYT